MGLDVLLYAEGDVTDEELATASGYMKARCPIVDTFDGKYEALGRSDEGEYERERIVFSTMNRYYGPGYERGDWPAIYGAIRLLQTALPRCRVFYGGDCYETGEECTPVFLSGIWAHFLGPNGDDYRGSRQVWMAELAKS